MTEGVSPSRHPIRVLCFSTLFPNEIQPRHGIFLRHRLQHLADEPGLALRVVAPVPWFPSRHPRFGRYAAFARVPKREQAGTLAVLHPRYPLPPRIGMTAAPLTMALAMLPTLRRLRREGFDFDVIDSYYLYPDGVAATILGALLARPVLMTAFGTDVSLIPTYAAPRRQLRWALRRAAGVTAVCQALHDCLPSLGAAPERSHVILHGVDQSLFHPPADRAALRRALEFSGPTLISVGHLIARKGHDLAIGALPSLPEVSLVIAGDGPEEAALRALADRLGVAGRVRFLGHVEQTRLVDLLGAADALVLCSDREGIANVLIEALACGTPVAATPIWGSPEVVTGPEAGVLFAERSLPAVVSGLRQLLGALPSRAATRCSAARFNWSQTVSRHAGLIEKAVAGREGTAMAEQRKMFFLEKKNRKTSAH